MIGQSSWVDSWQYGNDRANNTMLLGLLNPPSAIKDLSCKKMSWLSFWFFNQKEDSTGIPTIGSTIRDWCPCWTWLGWGCWVWDGTRDGNTPPTCGWCCSKVNKTENSGRNIEAKTALDSIKLAYYITWRATERSHPLCVQLFRNARQKCSFWVLNNWSKYSLEYIF